MVYAADSTALGVLETAAHIDSGGLPLNRFVIKIVVALKTWRAREALHPAKLDPAWPSVPAGKASIDLGSSWYQSGRSVLLAAPSVIVPEGRVVLINATHTDAKLITAQTIRTFNFNKVFRGA